MHATFFDRDPLRPKGFESERFYEKLGALLIKRYVPVFGDLKLAEVMAARLAFRSDSVVSLVYANPHPEFNCASLLGVEPRPFH